MFENENFNPDSVIIKFDVNEEVRESKELDTQAELQNKLDNCIAGSKEFYEILNQMEFEEIPTEKKVFRRRREIPEFSEVSSVIESEIKLNDEKRKTNDFEKPGAVRLTDKEIKTLFVHNN